MTNIPSFLGSVSHENQLDLQRTSSDLLNLGHRCQTIIDNECPNPSPCQNGGTCEDTATGYKCKCTGSYTGDKCQFTPCQVKYSDQQS